MAPNRYLIQDISTDRGVNTLRVEELHRFTIDGNRLVFDGPDSANAFAHEIIRIVKKQCSHSGNKKEEKAKRKPFKRLFR